MGEKYYKPILKEGDHLVRSKENENRVRGVSQDSNNKTTDIVEWEEYEIDDYECYSYEPEEVELTPEQKELAEAVGTALAAFVIYGAEKLNERVLRPWWHESAKPWIKKKFSKTKQLINGKTKVSQILEQEKMASTNKTVKDFSSNIQIDKMIDSAFDTIQFDMSSNEAKKHMMSLIYHMLGVAYEIKILSYTRIVDRVEDTQTRLENQNMAEQVLTQKVTAKINDLLSDEKLLLDVSTSKQLFNLLGGGIHINGEYVPVETEKVGIAINSMSKTEVN